jgi:hypothetical protein
MHSANPIVALLVINGLYGSYLPIQGHNFLFADKAEVGRRKSKHYENG